MRTFSEVKRDIEQCKKRLAALRAERESISAERDKARRQWIASGRDNRLRAILKARSRGMTFKAIGALHGVGSQRARELYLIALRCWEGDRL